MASGESWVNECKTIERYGQEIMEKINDRNRQRRTGGNHSKIQSDIRIMMKNYTRDLSNLKQALIKASSSYHISEREIERRQGMLDQLITKEKQLNAAFQTDSAAPDFGRSSLLSDQRLRDPTNPFDDEAVDTNNMDISDMRNQQQQVIAEQDRGLEALSGIIQRQKMVGQAIGDEVDTHNEIIDEITGNVDTTNVRLIKETRHVQRVTSKSSTCGMLIVIVLLLIVIIVVAVVPKP